MTTRIWLKPGVAEKNGKRDDSLKEITLGFENGMPCVTIHSDVMEPATQIPPIDPKLVSKYTYHGTYTSGMRNDGVYRLRGAEATVRTTTSVHEGCITTRWQTISISAKSVKTLREIYAKIRTGELKVDQDWGKSQTEIDSTTAKKPAPVPA